MDSRTPEQQTMGARAPAGDLEDSDVSRPAPPEAREQLLDDVRSVFSTLEDRADPVQDRSDPVADDPGPPPSTERPRSADTIETYASVLARTETIAFELRTLQTRVVRELEDLSGAVSRRPKRGFIIGALIIAVGALLIGFPLLAPWVADMRGAETGGLVAAPRDNTERAILDAVLEDVQLLRAELQRLQTSIANAQTESAAAADAAPSVQSGDAITQADLEAMIADGIAPDLGAELGQSIAQAVAAELRDELQALAEAAPAQQGAAADTQPSPMPDYTDPALRETLCASARLYDDIDPAYAARLRDDYCS